MQKRQFPMSEAEFEHFYSRVPKLAIEIVVVSNGGVVLTLRKHKSWNNLWHIPGVTLYYGELIDEAIARAGREELGIEVKKEKFLGYLQFTSEAEERGYGWSVTLDFLCTPLSELPKRNSEGEKIEVFRQLPENLVEEHRPLLEQVLDDLKQ